MQAKINSFKNISVGLNERKLVEKQEEEQKIMKGYEGYMDTSQQVTHVTSQEKLKIKQRMLKFELNVNKVYDLQEIFQFWISWAVIR